MAAPPEPRKSPRKINPYGMLVQADNLRKVYRIHEHQATTLKEKVVRNLFQREKLRDHVALEGVSFRLDRGHSLGVIGPNGSGKSTLLKLVAGIIEPTSGQIEVHGRVASLLELGAGFHPEFTGMENIFLQGRILGLSRSEILACLDEIIEFSGLGDFIHTPIKRYSTGMIVRLGFAIAAQFEADLLLVDEVLAVGDGAFQSRCLDRIQSLQRQGKSLLFVSHDLGQVERVAETVLWLDHGRVRSLGPTDEVLQAYEHEAQGTALAEGPSGRLDRLSATLMATVRQGTGEILIRGVDILRGDGHPTRRFAPDEPIHFAFDIEVVKPQPEIECWFALATPEGIKVGVSHSGQQALSPSIPPMTWKGLGPGRHRIVAELSPPVLPPGHYLLSCSVNPAGEAWVFFDMQLRMYRFRVEGPKGREGEPSPVAEGEFPASRETEVEGRRKPEGDAHPLPVPVTQSSTPSSVAECPGPPRATPNPTLMPPAVWEE